MAQGPSPRLGIFPCGNEQGNRSAGEENLPRTQRWSSQEEEKEAGGRAELIP